MHALISYGENCRHRALSGLDIEHGVKIAFVELGGDGVDLRDQGWVGEGNVIRTYADEGPVLTVERDVVEHLVAPVAGEDAVEVGYAGEEGAWDRAETGTVAGLEAGDREVEKVEGQDYGC